jgi:hypothetical protein
VRDLELPPTRILRKQVCSYLAILPYPPYTTANVMCFIASQHDYFVKRILHPSPRLLAQDSKPCHAQTHIHVPLPLALHPESPPHTHTAICPAWCAVLPTCHNHKHDRMIIVRELISSRCRVPYRIYRIRHLQWRQDKWSSDAVLSRISNPESIATLHFRRERE